MKNKVTNDDDDDDIKNKCEKLPCFKITLYRVFLNGMCLFLRVNDKLLHLKV